MAALCVDVDVAEIHTTLRSSIRENVGLIILLGAAFVALFLGWSRRNITTPIEELESCVVDFASKCRDQKDPEALKMNVPDIRTGNEVETLTGAFSEMSEAMQRYLSGMVTAEKAARDARTIAELQESMSALFNNMPGLSFSKDAETGVYLACNQAFAAYAHKPNPSGVVG